MAKIIVPQNFQMNAISRFAAQIVGSDGKPVDSQITLDFAKLNFIDGSGYTVLSNSMQWLVNNGVKITVTNYRNLNNLAIQYLDDCGFFEKYLKKPLRPEARVRSTTLPCVHIEHERSFEWVEKKLSPWIQWHLMVNYGQLASVRTCVKEVLNNIADHSTVDTGFVHAQFYPNAKQVKITMSDFGLGIPNTIRSRYGAMSDVEAIIHATKDGVTAQSQPNNMGAGLSYLVDTILANRGVVRFHSLSGNLTCVCDNKGRKTLQRRTGTGLYPGTLIELELDKRLFVGDDDDRTDFEW